MINGISFSIFSTSSLTLKKKKKKSFLPKDIYYSAVPVVKNFVGYDNDHVIFSFSL